MLEEESRGSVREWAARLSLGNCECLWQAAEDKWRHKSVSGEIIGDTCPKNENNKSNKLDLNLHRGQEQILPKAKGRVCATHIRLD